MRCHCAYSLVCEEFEEIKKVRLSHMDMESSKSKPASSTNSKIKKCVGKDSFERMNYLYQACNAMATENSSSNAASVMYSNLLVAVSRKAVQRLDVDVKRTICKGCRCLLLAGITCKVRIKKKRSIWVCTKCQTRKVFVLSTHQPWTQQDESLVELLDYQNNCL